MDTPINPPSRSLKRRALLSGMWSFGGFGTNNVLRLVSNLILTRLLMPEAFGLMALATAFHVWIGQMTDLGVNASVIRSKQGEDPAFLATAWTVQIARNALIAVLLAVVSFIMIGLRNNNVFNPETVYADPRLPIFMWFISLNLLINGFKSMREPLAQRGLDMSRLIGLEIGSQIIAIAATVSFAINGHGVYSLVYGMLAASIVRTLGSYVVLKGPSSRFGFDRKHFDEIFNYGKWLLIASFFGFIVSRGDQVLLGLYLAKAEFGFYAIAGISAGVAAAVVQSVQQRVCYPAFSEIHRDRPHDLTRIYGKLRLLSDAGSILIFLVLFLFADFLIDLIYTDDYSRVAYYLKLLAIGVLFIPYRLLNIVILTSGDSRRFTIITVAPGAALFLMMPVMYHYVGIEAAIVFAASIQIFAIPFAWRFASKLISLNPLREGILLLIAATAALSLVGD